MTAGAHTRRVSELLGGLMDGHRASLGRALTLVESTHPSDMTDAAALLDACLKHCGTARSMAITGVPGAGKSTLVDELGMGLIESGHRVAVLAVDPSSLRTGGSVLGDKTRMERLSRSGHAFIRPSPTRGTLGGVAAHTRRSMILCAAAGYDRVLVETVGVGQSEVAVASMVQCVLLVLLAGAGDGLQGIKRGILEVPDIVAFNKSDAVHRNDQDRSIRHTHDAMHMLRPDVNVPVVGVSAVTGDGLQRLAAEVTACLEQTPKPFMPDATSLFHESTTQLISHALQQGEGPFRPLLEAARDRLHDDTDDGPWSAAAWFYNQLNTELGGRR
ncbi:MAG: methylmalonyl Co-A mutase-associated GTPase MeaB [Bacteroidetes bacterium CG12_big_fil_rev_8_21_14_0_65_60_17]|nr:MAG: methylmalonyl Co-A mutase-associated GTPase MeaB [Bacteroidetes bacterium CG12_big_fil_rev_8_21_14_0_65_60_17]